MRLLQLGPSDELILTGPFLPHDVPPFAILSHTWGQEDDEVTFDDIREKKWTDRPGHHKIVFCGRQAKCDGINYFWVDTCCIDKTNFQELLTAINSMFIWYSKAQKCYAYLVDVKKESSELEFRDSKWFKRGWTLAELLAPRSVEFYSEDHQRLGSKQSLEQIIHEITRIPPRALQDNSLSAFTAEEQISWSNRRETKYPEDKAYSLLGMLGVNIPLLYGEGEKSAFERLRAEISRQRSLQSAVVASLSIAEDAIFNSHAEKHNSQCIRNTRTEILQDVTEWALAPNTKNVYWLNGMAGTGKSTIARTVAHNFAEGGALGGTFFFRRGEDDRSKVSKLFATIASQLIQRMPEIAVHIQATLNADPTIFSKALREQLYGLIVDPVSRLQSAASMGLSLLIIIDALDECEREEDIKVLIELLFTVKTQQPIQLKFFLTSRPELPIRLGIEAVDGSYQDFILHEEAQLTIEHDITAYLEHELSQIRLDFNRSTFGTQQLAADWPAKSDIRVLVKMTVPLFIFAATVCRFVSDRKGGNPDKNLQRVLDYQTKQGSRLDNMYSLVLEQLVLDFPQDEQQDILQQFKSIVGPIVVLKNPLSISALAQLLDVASNNILDTLDLLHSVLNIPSSIEQPVRLLHPSFRDFLIDPARYNNLFWINEKRVHQHLATRSLRILSTSLKNDICEVRALGTLASSVSAKEINTKLLPEIQYACRFWIHHVQNSEIDENSIWEFLSSHFLQWLEALSWIGRFLESLQMVQDLRSLFQPRNRPKISGFLDDAVRFIQAASSGIHVAPLQVYSSALVFSPTQTVVRRVYEQGIPTWLELKPQVPSTWCQNIQTLKGSSVVFSPNSKLVVSGSYGRTVEIWAAETGTLQQTLRGHKRQVSSVAFSSDSKLVASGSNDETVKIWVAESGTLQQTLGGHTGWVSSVAFSPNSKFVASASYDMTVKIWVAETGALQQTLRGHTDWVSSVAFSSDSKLVASASGDKTVKIWAIETGALQKTIECHTSAVASVAFSPDSKLLATGSYDNTVKIWASETGALQQTLEGHEDSVNSVAFSPNRKLVASGSEDETVRIWAVETGVLQQTLEGHTDPVLSVAFSLDSKLLASGSEDDILKIWATETGALEQTLESHTSSVTSVALSPDSKLVASGSHDKAIKIWISETGALQQTLEGHTSSVTSVVFSPDSKLVASGSHDKTVKIWTAETGTLQQTFSGHTGWVSSVAFSSDSKLVASASDDNTVKIWIAETGTLQQTLRGHTDWVSSVAFSPDSKLVVSGSHDKAVKIWAAETGALQQTLECHTSAVTLVVFSPNSKLVASASYDKTVKIWAAETGALQQTFEIETVSRTLKFDAESTQVLTDVGAFLFHHPETLSAKNYDNHISAPTLDRKPSNIVRDVGYSISQDESWIRLDGTNILWLPTEYRPEKSAISGSTVIIGCRSGQVLIIRFKHEEIARLINGQ